jgi:hypothetical protein
MRRCSVCSSTFFFGVSDGARCLRVSLPTARMTGTFACVAYSRKLARSGPRVSIASYRICVYALVVVDMNALTFIAVVTITACQRVLFVCALLSSITSTPLDLNGGWRAQGVETVMRS